MFLVVRKAKAVEARAVMAVLARPRLCKITDDLYRAWRSLAVLNKDNC